MSHQIHDVVRSASQTYVDTNNPSPRRVFQLSEHDYTLLTQYQYRFCRAGFLWSAIWNHNNHHADLSQTSKLHTYVFFVNAKEPTLHHDALLATHHQGWFCIALNFIYDTVFYTLFKADLNFDMSLFALLFTSVIFYFFSEYCGAD